MKLSAFRTVGLVAMIVGAGALGSANAVAQEPNPYDGRWHYSGTIYGWVPNVYATFDFPRAGDPTLEVKPHSYLSDLNFAIMLAGQAQKGDWGIATDLVYFDLSSLSSKITHVRRPDGIVALPVNVDVNSGVRATIWTLVGSYNVSRSQVASIDLIGGVRYGGFRASTDWNLSGPLGLLSPSGSAAESVNLWDGIVGTKGFVRLSDDGRWFVPFEADIGGGNSNWTWNAMAGIGYRFSWGDLIAMYRNLEFKQTGGDKLIENLRLTGPLVGVTFHW